MPVRINKALIQLVFFHNTQSYYLQHMEYCVSQVAYLQIQPQTVSLRNWEETRLRVAAN